MQITVKKSVAAGIVLAIGSFANMTSTNKLVGAFLLALAFVAVKYLDLPMLTNKICRYDCRQSYLFTVFLGNSLGITISTLIGAFAVPNLLFRAKEMAICSFSVPLVSVFLASILGGICCQAANQTKNEAVAAFFLTALSVLSLKHIIISIPLLMLTNITPVSLLKLLLILLGNLIGTTLFWFLTKHEEICS